MKTPDDVQAEVRKRTRAIAELIMPTLPIDEITATALLLLAASAVRWSGKCTREQFLASAASCFDVVPDPRP